ncbi:MAG: hypothetical protein WKG32_14540 [Gemmatimonadaceae bacterium]
MGQGDTDKPRPADDEEVILLKDLTPTKDVKGGGGAGKILFGQETTVKKDEPR